MDEKFFDARESENLLQSTDSISKGLSKSGFLPPKYTKLESKTEYCREEFGKFEIFLTPKECRNSTIFVRNS